jgi:RNA polymerase-binding transcription factor DksA
MEAFRRRLLEMKQAAAHAVEARLHGQGEHRHDEAGLPRHADETDDDGAAETARQADVAHLARTATVLRDIEAALARIDSGEYGQCVDCEEAIDERRLLAYPAAVRCARCQQDFETRRSRGGARP